MAYDEKREMPRVAYKAPPPLTSRLISALGRSCRSLWAIPGERRAGLVRIRPCYHVDSLSLGERPMVVDLGPGCDANFSKEMMERFGAQCFAFEPTKKHHPALRALEQASAGKFRLVRKAAAGECGRRTFYEERRQESGSLIEAHSNVGSGALKYEVDVLDLKGIFEICEAREINVLKIDIEGAEYDFLLKAPSELLWRIRQILVEFHHHCVADVSEADNERVIEHLAQLNFLHHSIDGVNYIFFRRLWAC